MKLEQDEGVLYLTVKRYDAKEEKKIIEYMPLVENIVDRMQINSRQGLSREDYIALGLIGLMEAFDKFDTSLNIPFKHYAKWRIKGAIYDELRKNGTISRSSMDKLNRMYQVKEKLQQNLLREPSDYEVAECMGINVEELGLIYESSYHLSYSYLEGTLFSGDEEFSIMDVIEDNKAIDPQKRLDDDENKSQLIHAIQCLSEKEQILLNLYYKEELKLKEIALILDISISRVSQIHGKVLLKLRNLLQKNMRGKI